MTDAIKQEPPEEESMLSPDEIKIEECQLKYEPEDSPPLILKANQMIIEKELPICVSCKVPFERTKKVRLHDTDDRYKCNKCILHSRLKHAFKTKGKISKAQKTSIRDSVVVKKIISLCLSCKCEFQRDDNVRLKEESDWLKCNKCILHTRLNAVFRSKKSF